MFEQFELKVFSGYVTEPDIKYFDSGKCKCTFSIPLKENKDADAKFLNCVTWGNIAEKVAENYKKGDIITVAGQFEKNEYKGKEYINLNVKAVF